MKSLPKLPNPPKPAYMAQSPAATGAGSPTPLFQSLQSQPQFTAALSQRRSLIGGAN